jgi:hypothetical protein
MLIPVDLLQSAKYVPAEQVLAHCVQLDDLLEENFLNPQIAHIESPVSLLHPI